MIIWTESKGLCHSFGTNKDLMVDQCIEDNAKVVVENCLCAQERVILALFPSCEATKEISTKITLSWVHIRFVTTVHTLLYFLHNVRSPYCRPRIQFPHINTVPLLLSLRSGDDVTINRAMLVMTSQLTWQLWRTNVKVIHSSIVIDFMYSDIHGQSC